MVTVEFFKDGFWYLCGWDGEPYKEWPPIFYARSKVEAEMEDLAKRVNDEGLDPWSLVGAKVGKA